MGAATEEIDSSKKRDLLKEAVAFYRGDFMAGFSLRDSPGFDDWQFFQGEQVRQDVVTAWQNLIELECSVGNFDHALPYARQWTALDGLDEEAQRWLIKLYAWLGQRTSALRQYQEYATHLKTELGITPEPETAVIYEQVLANELAMPAFSLTQPDILPIPEPPTPTRLYNLPSIANPFVGRQKELAAIRQRLKETDCRLLNLIGPGGIGKTRLALEVAHSVLDQYANGVFFVPLTQISTADHLIPAIVDTLEVQFFGREELTIQLINYLRDKQLLLLLDNVEHVLDGATHIIGQLLRQSHQLTILTTSQETLKLSEEWLFEVQRFPCVPDDQLPESSAYQLFWQRAQQIKPDFQIALQNVPFVGQICRLVDGLPLGIELAATWVRLLTCRQIVAQMQDSIDFLTTPLREIPERHRSLRAVFEHSWQLLSHQEQKTFANLTLFRDGFRLPAAISILDVSLPVLVALMDKSLLRRTANERYKIPEVLYQFTQAKYADRADQALLDKRFANYYLKLLAEQEGPLKRDKQQEALITLREEIENIHRAWWWAVAEGELQLLQNSLMALFLYYDMRSWAREGMQTFHDTLLQLETVASDVDEFRSLAGRLLVVQGALTVRLSRYDDARQLLERSLAILRPLAAKRGVALALFNLGIVAETAGNYDKAIMYHEESLALYRTLVDRWGVAHVLMALGNISHLSRKHEAARRYYQESLVMHQHSGNQRGIALCFHNLGNVEHALDASHKALELYAQSAKIKRTISDRRGLGYSRNNMGDVARTLGNYEVAQRHLDEALYLFSEVGDRRGVGYVRFNLGELAYEQAQYHLADTRFRESLSLFASIGDRINEALALKGLGDVAFQHGNYDEAHSYYEQTIDVTDSIGAQTIRWEAQLGLAQVAVARQQTTVATQLAQNLLADKIPESIQAKANKILIGI